MADSEDSRAWEDDPDPKEVEDQNRDLLRRQQEFRRAATRVAAAFAAVPAVRRVALFGSVALPLEKEVPRFRRFRRAGIRVWHECQDVDLAVWLDDLGCLRALQKASARALNALLQEESIGVAHHQVDVFLFEPGTDRYLGRLCRFSSCPREKLECRVPGCGATLFLRQHEDFHLDPRSLDPGRQIRLLDRSSLPT